MKQADWSYLIQQLGIEVIAVVEDVSVGRVQAGSHAVLHHGAGARWALQFQHLEQIAG